MKTKIYSLILFCGVFLFLNSCSEEKINLQVEPYNLKSSEIVYGVDIPLIENTQNAEELILNPNDSEDEKINTFLYYLSLSICDLVHNVEFNQEVIRLAKDSPAHTANLITLTDSFPNFKSEINQRLSSRSITFDEIAENLTYSKEGVYERYVPCIFIPNLDIADKDRQPILSPGIEIDCAENEDVEDYIVAWYFTKLGVKIEVMLGEEDSKRTTNPIFILDNGEINLKGNDFEILPPVDEGLKSMLSSTKFWSNEFRINHHYEPAPGRSEFTIVAYRISPQGTAHWIYNSSGWKEIAKVKRSDVGKELSKWSLHCGNYTPYADNYVIWNTYERDWNRSSKGLGSVTQNGTTIHLGGRRKNTHEWYAWHPDSLQGNHTRLNHIYQNWAELYQSDKSKLKIWRVD
jgi:hypothetical protein